MQPSGFEFYAIGDAALALGVARSNLRYYIDIGRVPSRRASDGSRLLSHDDMKSAREWIESHEAEKRKLRAEKRRAQSEALKKIRARSQRAVRSKRKA